MKYTEEPGRDAVPSMHRTVFLKKFYGEMGFQGEEGLSTKGASPPCGKSRRKGWRKPNADPYRLSP
jgi:hypothetical protein